jgi:hypothetical protein
LTYDFVKGIKSLKDFNNKILSKFPLLFFKNGNEYGFTPTKRFGNISYVLNLEENVQDIFTNPIGDLMENEGLSFDEAHMKLYGCEFAKEYANRFGISLEKAREILTDLPN